MSDKNEQEEDGFFNPFQELRRELDKKAPAPAPRPAPTAAKAAGSKPATRPGKPSANAEDEAALFLQAVSNPGFKPMKEHTQQGGRRTAPGRKTAEAKDAPPATPAPCPVPATPAPAAAKAAPVSQSDKTAQADEGGLDLFASAMRGVRPVDGKGRDLAPPKPEPKINMAEDHDYLQDLLQGKVEFSLEHSDEFFEGHVMGLDPLVLAKLRAGQYSPESHIDLHGQTAELAQESLTTFIRHAYNKGQRSLVVVTGRGKNSPGGLSILRQNMQDWLTREPLKRAVLAFCTAQPKDGGAGAIYVLLRKYKKSGKIRWDRRNWPQTDI